MNTKKHFKRAFTIVELLIVIAVIAILATLTIVAYSNVQQGARDKSVLSDLDTLDGLETEYGQRSSGGGEPWYSASGPDSNLGSFVPSAGNVIDIVLNNATPSLATGYCIRGYNSSSATYTSLAKAAVKESTVGICQTISPSAAAQTDSPLPPPIINLIQNPSVESGVQAPNGGYYGPPAVIDSTTAVAGTQSVEVTTNSTTYPQGYIWTASNVLPNTNYVCSVYLMGTPGSVVNVAGRVTDTTGAYVGEGYGWKLITLTSSWQRVSVSFTSPANTGSIYIQYHLNSAASGINIWGDAAMCTQGTTLYDYADGSYTMAGWSWTGTANNSTSTGKPL